MTNLLAVTALAAILSIAVGVIAAAFLNSPTASATVKPASGNLLLLLRLNCFTVVPVATFTLLIVGYSVLMGTLTPLSAVQSLTDLLSANTNFLHSLVFPTDPILNPPSSPLTLPTPLIAPEGTPTGPPEP